MNYNRDAAAMPGRCEEVVKEAESMLALIGRSEEIAKSVETTVCALESNLFGCEERNAPQDEPSCFRDICAQHAERMKRINATLSSVKERLGV